MKRVIVILTAISLLMTLAALSLAGCSKDNSGTQEPAGGPNPTAANSANSLAGEKLSIVCTVFPAYDWARNIIGDTDDILLFLLLDKGVDMHNYAPSIEDIATASSCDLFIYIGGESDEWVEDIAATNPNRVALNLLEELGDAANLEEIIEGMEHDDDHDDHDGDHDDDHDDDHEHGFFSRLWWGFLSWFGVKHDHDHDDDHDHEEHYDEHYFMSLKMAELCSAIIADAIKGLDSENADKYDSNLSSYLSQLGALDAQYEGMTAEASTDTLLVADRFPLRYLVDDYGLDYYAAFSGCSAANEASFETIIFLAEKLNELGLQYVLVTENSDKSIATAVINATNGKNQTILVFESFHGVSAAEVAAGYTYLGAMERNLEVLREALS